MRAEPTWGRVGGKRAPMCVTPIIPLFLPQRQLAMAGLTTVEGFSTRYSSAVWSNTDQQLLGSDCSPLLQKVPLWVGSPKGYSVMNKIASYPFILPAQWNHMSKVSKPGPSGYDVYDRGAVMRMARYELALSFTAYTCPLNFEALQLEGEQHFAVWTKKVTSLLQLL